MFYLCHCYSGCILMLYRIVLLCSVQIQQNFQAGVLCDFCNWVSSMVRPWNQKISSSEAIQLVPPSYWWCIQKHPVIIQHLKVSGQHLVHDIQQILGRLHKLYKFQWTFISCFPMSKMGSLPLAVRSMLWASSCNGALRVAFSFVRLHVYRIRSEMCFSPCVF